MAQYKITAKTGEEYTIDSPAELSNEQLQSYAENPQFSGDSAPIPPAPVTPAAKKPGYFSGLGKWVTEDIPNAATTLNQQLNRRGAAIDAPTKTGKAFGLEPGSWAEAAVSAPERLLRTGLETAGGFADVADFYLGGKGVVTTAADRLLGGSLSKFGELANKPPTPGSVPYSPYPGMTGSITPGTPQKPGTGGIPDITKGIQKVEEIKKNLPPEDQANLDALLGGAKFGLYYGLPGGKQMEQLVGNKAAEVGTNAWQAVKDIKIDPHMAPTIEASARARDQKIKEAAWKGVQPTERGAGINRDKWESNFDSAIKTIAENKDAINTETGKKAIQAVDNSGREVLHAETNDQLLQNTDQAMDLIWQQVEAKEKAAGGKGALLTQEDIKPVEAIADKVIVDPAYPEEYKQFAEKQLERYRKMIGQSPSVVSRFLKIINDEQKGIYLNPDKGSKTKNAIDMAMAAELREVQDAMISKLEGEGYQELRNKYGALKSVRKDINHRANVIARKADKGFFDLTDAFTNGEIAYGVLTANAPMVAKGVAGRATKELIKHHNNPDRYIRRAMKAAYDHEDLKAGVSKNPLYNEQGYATVPDFTKPTEGGQGASTLRGNQEINAQEGNVPEVSQDLGGEDIQRQQEAWGAGTAPREAAPQAGESGLRPDAGLTRKQRVTYQQLKDLATKQDAREAAAEVDPITGAQLTPLEIHARKTNEVIDFLQKEGYTLNEEGTAYVKDTPENVKAYWSSVLGEPIHDPTAPGVFDPLKPPSKEVGAGEYQPFSAGKKLARGNEPAGQTVGGEPEYTPQDNEFLDAQESNSLTPDQSEEASFWNGLSQDEINSIYDHNSVTDISSAPKDLREHIIEERTKSSEAMADEKDLQKATQYPADELSGLQEISGKGNLPQEDRFTKKREQGYENIKGNLSQDGLNAFNSLATELGYDPDKILTHEVNEIVKLARKKVTEANRAKRKYPTQYTKGKNPPKTEQTTLEGFEDKRKPAEIEKARIDAEKKAKQKDNPLEGTPLFDKNEQEAMAAKQEKLDLEPKLSGVDKKIEEAAKKTAKLTSANSSGRKLFNELKASGIKIDRAEFWKKWINARKKYQ